MLDFTAYDRVLDAPWLIKRFQDRYVDRKRLRQVGLMWNAYLPQYEPRCLPFEEITKLGIPKDKKLFFYSERPKMLYSAGLDAVVDYVEQLEPWEDIDAYLFDKTMDWVVAITHEDRLILWLGPEWRQGNDLRIQKCGSL